jgi:hypothetical protein
MLKLRIHYEGCTVFFSHFMGILSVYKYLIYILSFLLQYLATAEKLISVWSYAKTYKDYYRTFITYRVNNERRTLYQNGID